MTITTQECTGREAADALEDDPRICSERMAAILWAIMCSVRPEDTEVTVAIRTLARKLGYADARPVGRAINLGLRLGYLERVDRVRPGGPWRYQITRPVSA